MTSVTSDLELLPGYFIDPASDGAWMTIPWPRDADAKDHLLRNSLGPSLIRWAEGVGDEPGALIDYQTGRPWRFTSGQKRFLILWYFVGPDDRWVFRSGVKRGAKGTGKDPFAAAWLNLELMGPSRFAGRDALGLPVGERHGLPLVQVASNSEAQSKDVLRVANAMVPRHTRDEYGFDAGETRSIIAGGGRMELLTASEKSSEGDPATAIALNESHHMTQASGGHNIAAVARRNVGKSPAWIQARLLEFTNAHMQGMDSVAERSFDAWQTQLANPLLKRDILYDSIEADPRTDIADPVSLMRGIRQAYSDAHWADHERIRDEAMDSRTSVGDTVRFYLNGLGTAEDAWVDPNNFDGLARDSMVVEPGDEIAMFLDCSKSDDATAFMGCRLSDGFNFVIGVWQRPHGDRGNGWLAPRAEVDAKVREAVGMYRVAWFGVDPSPAEDEETEANYWMPLIDAWHRDFRNIIPNWATPGAPGTTGHSVLYDMRRSAKGGAERVKATTEMCELLAARIDEEKDLIHDGDPRLRVHVHNARRRPNAFGIGIGKETRSSSKKIDLAFSMVGANVGRRIALNSGKTAKKKTGRVW
jgi:hypothetical protein